MTIPKSMRIAVAAALIGAPASAEEPPAPEEPKAHIFASVLFNTQTFSFSQGRSYPLNEEEASFRSTWSSETGPAFSIGGSYAVFRGLRLGVALELVETDASESFTADLPHPLFFGQDRRLEGEATGLSYSERAVHVLLGYSKTFGRIVLAVSGGPSFFSTSTELIGDFTYTESYPFDEAAVSSVQTATYDASKVGFNLGGRLGFRVADFLALGLDVRISKSTPRFTTSNGTEVDISAGGLRVGGGVLLLF
jgi:hypothetical protein